LAFSTGAGAARTGGKLRLGNGGGFLARISAAAVFGFWLADTDGPAGGKGAGDALPLALPGALPFPPVGLGFF
jgi:hypothetical protein